MASIYSGNGNTLTEGLQGCNVCDAAIQSALRLAKTLEEPVYLDDDDGEWTVHPDGDVEEGWDF